MGRSKKPRSRPPRKTPPDPPFEMSIACPRCSTREHHPGPAPVCPTCGAAMERAYFVNGERVDAAAFRAALRGR